MKVAFFEVSQEWEKKLIEKSCVGGCSVLIFEESINDVDVEKFCDVDIISVFIYSKCDKKVLSKLKNLKLINTRSTGFDHIDLEFARKKKVLVSNVPHYGENTVAEFTFALLLTISRKIIESVNRVRSGSFDFEGLRGFDLAGKVVGVIGYGNIGQKFVDMCLGFNMKVIVFDVNADKFSGKVSKKIEFVSLEELFSRAEIISLHIPLLKSTKHILDKKAFDKMRDNVIVLNTSRGDLINSKDLVEALNSKKVLGAGLDVLEGECMIKDEIELLNSEVKKQCDLKIVLEDHILINHPRVYVTPHNAFNTIDALNRILETSISDILLFSKKGKIENEVK